MLIGIDGSRAFLKNRTGIEEYSYQTIKNLRDKLAGYQVVLYVRGGEAKPPIGGLASELPENWKIKTIRWPRFWTQVGLSLEMLLHPVDVLFVPAHTVPIIHPKNTIVTIHGLEYEFCPDAYSFWAKLYMRWTIRKSCQWAKSIISVSENTKKDLIKLYKVPENKISVIYEGYEKVESEKLKAESKIEKPYLLFIGRIEERKNISNIIKAFEMLKEKHDIPHKLVLAGKPGHGYESIKLKVQSSKFKDEIIELGFVSEEEKWELLKNADVFVFPTQYEGFGIPVLEAQSVGCPVVAGNNSSIPEVVSPKVQPLVLRRLNLREEDLSALLVDEKSPEDIAEAVHKLISDEGLKNAIIDKGLENVKRFSWDKCSEEIANVLTK